MVLPVNSKIRSDGHLEIGGLSGVELAKEFGTPLFVMDEEMIRDNCRRYLKSFRDLSSNTEVIFASKAFVALAMCQIIQEEGLSLDVASGGELYTAKKAAFPPERLFLHGNNKTPGELELALRVGVGTIVVDSMTEIDLLDSLAKEKEMVQDVMLRITPGIKPSTHTFIQTGQIDSKFGFGLADGVAMEAIKATLTRKNLNPVGLHAHIGSQIFALHSYAKAIEIVAAFAEDVYKETGFLTEALNLGGGLGIKYGADDEPATIEEYAEAIVGGVEAEMKKRDLPCPKILVEPGRSIVGNAGVTLYTVGTIKEIPSVRTYLAVDGGMSDNLRPMLYGAVYEALLADRADLKGDHKVTVVGKHCESGDVLIKDVLLPQPKVGDILCTPATGAYGYTMANNYNKQPRPAVVMVKDGTAKVIIRRESYEDLVRLDSSL
ncbi:MAG: diaminopimelate decarboxylase [Actinomycetota bacterium]|nr:diaminopimelate decarboxylase [Actinomycetota bacterium]